MAWKITRSRRNLDAGAARAAAAGWCGFGEEEHKTRVLPQKSPEHGHNGEDLWTHVHWQPLDITSSSHN